MDLKKYFMKIILSLYIYTFEVNILINNKQYIRFELITINNIV